MKTEKELNADILQMIAKIEKNSPELSKYIDEMRLNVSGSEIDSSEVNQTQLKDYYDSLCSLYNSHKENMPK